LPWSYAQVWDYYTYASRDAGIGHVSTHVLRHTYRSWLDAVGTPIAVQQKMMRHTDIRTTLNIYGDVITDEMAVAGSKIARLALNGAQTERKQSASLVKCFKRGGQCRTRTCDLLLVRQTSETVRHSICLNKSITYPQLRSHGRLRGCLKNLENITGFGRPRHSRHSGARPIVSPLRPARHRRRSCFSSLRWLSRWAWYGRLSASYNFPCAIWEWWGPLDLIAMSDSTGNSHGVQNWSNALFSKLLFPRGKWCELINRLTMATCETLSGPAASGLWLAFLQHEVFRNANAFAAVECVASSRLASFPGPSAGPY
jgi:hypothetical protein